jgi:hypothetical protein
MEGFDKVVFRASLGRLGEKALDDYGTELAGALVSLKEQHDLVSTRLRLTKRKMIMLKYERDRRYHILRDIHPIRRQGLIRYRLNRLIGHKAMVNPNKKWVLSSHGRDKLIVENPTFAVRRTLCIVTSIGLRLVQSRLFYF